jgi:hypothetical protein
MPKKKQKWSKPVLKRLRAGGAELGGTSAGDIGAGHS